MGKKASGVFVLLSLFFTAGCGGNAFKTGKAWNPNETPFFDDGVDVVEDLSSLSGKWAYDQEKDLDGRVQLADLIANVEVVSIQTTSDFDVETGKRIEVRITSILYGGSPSREIVLVSSRETPGHELIVRYENRLNGSYFLFVRWFKDSADSLSHHFHLSLGSQRMEAEIKRRIDLRKREEEKEAAKGR
jgi:hypothetical protein